MFDRTNPILPKGVCTVKIESRNYSILLFLFTSIILTSCDGDVGPPGPPGPSGTHLASLNCTEEGDKAVFTGLTWVCESDLPRFVDNGDGTISDNETGLMWERKLAANGTEGGNCADADQSNRDVRCVQNIYTWTGDLSGFGTAADGTLYTDFLAGMNPDLSIASTDDTSQSLRSCLAGHCDWRVPNIVELQTIQLAPCESSPCIDTAFGPTKTGYWSSSDSVSGPTNGAWDVSFYREGTIFLSNKANVAHARAVRGGR